MENEILKMTVLFIISAGVLYVVYTLTSNRSQHMLFRWAEENGYQILDYQAKILNRGPFFWASKGQLVFRVAVEDAHGTQRTGWVRCGSYWGGIFSYEVDVKWDNSAVGFNV
jgi:hypothetical protein